eukprot:gene8583-10561_t
MTPSFVTFEDQIKLDFIGRDTDNLDDDINLFNKFTCGDLVIKFPFTDEQQEQLIRQQRGLEQMYQSLSEEGNKKAEILAALSGVTELNQFEKRQIQISPLPFQKHIDTYQLQYDTDSYLQYITTIKDPYLILSSKNKPDFNYTQNISISDLLKLDRSTRFFTVFRDTYHKVIHPENHILSSATKEFYGDYKFANKGLPTLPITTYPWGITLAKINPDNTMLYCSINISSYHNYIFNIKMGQALPETSATYDQFFGTKKECEGILCKKFKDLTGKELTSNTINEQHQIIPTKENFGFLLDITEPNQLFSIPSLKNICFSTLKTMFLMENSPIGNEVIQLLNGKITDPVHREILFPPTRVIKANFTRDEWFNNIFCNAIPQNFKYPSYKDQFAVNVYQDPSLFIVSEYFDQDRILFKSTSLESLNVGETSIVDYDTFISIFGSEFNGIFIDPLDDQDWEHMVVIGGFMTRCLTGDIKGFESSDIDICFYGLNGDSKKMSDIIYRLYKKIVGSDEKEPVSISSTTNQLIISRHYPHRHIQINFEHYVSIEEILTGIDIDASCFAFDGKSVWTLERGILSMNSRVNFASGYGMSIRGEGIYQRRLIKYLDRGFGIVYLKDEKLDESIKNFKYPLDGQYGMARLYCAYLSPSVLNYMVKRNSKASLPYGIGWDIDRFNKYIEEQFDHFYDGYNDNKIPQLLKSHKDLASLIELICVEFCFKCKTTFSKDTWDLFLDESDNKDVDKEKSNGILVNNNNTNGNIQQHNTITVSDQKLGYKNYDHSHSNVKSSKLDFFLNLNEFQLAAEKGLPRMVYDYYASGSDSQITLKQNQSCFENIKIIPRCLVNVESVNLKTKILGFNIDFPVMVSPTAMQKMATPMGELATYKAVKENGTIMTLSSLSTTSVEELSEASGGNPGWFQLYVFKDRSISENLVRRAEKLGFSALMLTVDTPFLGRREADYRNEFRLPDGLQLKNFSDLPMSNLHGGLNQYIAAMIDPSLTWKDIDWLKSITKLPIVVKGVMCTEDAELALAHGVDAIVVSNHGARQLDTCPATIEVLPSICRVVGDRVPVILDGGIRRGTDILKAIAFGAKAVMIGRPVLWGLAVGGQQGVSKVLTLLRNELALSMALSGIKNVSDISPKLIWSAKL